MTIDQLIAELHKRREALVQKGYPEAHVDVRIVATETGLQLHAVIFGGLSAPIFRSVDSYHDIGIDALLDRVDNEIMVVDPKVPVSAYDNWFSMAQLAERAAS